VLGGEDTNRQDTKGVSVELRPYQIDLANKGAEILKKYGMVYLAMQTRTGKSLTALEIAKLCEFHSVLFLTKKKAIASIVSDYENFGYEYRLYTTNYEQLGNLTNSHFELIICDEAHCMGAYPKPSLRTKILKARMLNTPVIYLSGTPTPEGYSQIFHQLWISNYSPYKNYLNFYRWAKDYVKVQTVRRGIYTVNDYSNADEERIKKDIAPFFLTYTQEEAGFHCPVEEHFLEVEDAKVATLIREIFKKRVLQFEAGMCVGDTPAGLLNKMHQLSGGTCICEKDNLRTVEIISHNKINFIADNFKGKRLAVFYKFKAERDVILSRFPNATESPEDFQNGLSDTFVSQVLSGREGIALCSADIMVFYNLDHSATSYFQAKARLQDLKRTTPAQVYWVFTKGGIEKKVYKAISDKKDFTYSYFMRHVASDLVNDQYEMGI